MIYEIKDLINGEPHFVDPVPQNLLCMLCNNIMIDSTYLPCGCEFCRECLEKYFENQEKLCPCKDKMHPSNESKYEFQRDSGRSDPKNFEILKLKLKCKNCDEVKSIEEMSKHKDECCDKKMNSNNLTKNMIDEINTLNQIMLNMINNLINEQYTLNNKQFEENSQLKDEIRIFRADFDSFKVENHKLKNDLKNCRTDVNSIKVGNQQLKDEMRFCLSDIITIKEENQQLKDEMSICRAEISTIKEENQQLKIQMKNYQTEINSIKVGNQQMRNEVKNCRANINSNKVVNQQLRNEMKIFRENYKKENKELKCQNKVLESRMQQLTKEIDKISSDQQIMKNTNQNSEFRLTYIKTIEANLAIFDKMKKDNEIIFKELNLINQYMWTIEGFTDKRNQHMDLYSDPFFTHRSGYKIRLRFVTQGLNFRNFIFGFQIIKGKFDDGLSWPMRRQIKICLLNQDTGEDSDVADIFDFDESSNNLKDRFNKPTEQDNKICAMSFNYDKIDQTSYGFNHNSLFKNDKIIIKCVTFPPDIHDIDNDYDNDYDNEYDYEYNYEYDNDSDNYLL